MFTLKEVKVDREGEGMVEVPQTDREDSSAMSSSCESLTNSKSEANSIGSPLQTSSPKKVDMYLGDGKGDNHSIRPVQNLLSPICCAMMAGYQQLSGSKIIETPPESRAPCSKNACPAPVTPDSFLKNFDKSSAAAQKSPRACPLQQELIISEKISKMDEAEAKKILTRVVIDNMGLRQELRAKDKRITAYKGQMLAILDWKAKQEEGESSDSTRGFSRLPHSTTGVGLNNKKSTKVKIQKLAKAASSSKSRMQKKKAAITTTTTEDSEQSESAPEKDNTLGHSMYRRSQEFTVVEEVNGITRSLSLFQELVSSMDLDQDVLKDRLKHGYRMTNQLIVGGLAGWTSAMFLKKFGKLALSATCGGLVLLVYTARKGFVNVNYESIYQEISRICDGADAGLFDDDTPSKAPENCGEGKGELEVSFNNCGGDAQFTKSRDNLNACRSSGELPQMYDKLQQAKTWIMSHTYTVGGFALTFVYNLL